jgi:hypothetical protein
MFSYTAFIPRVFSNIKESRIINTFDALQIGSVEHVDLVPKTNAKGESYNMAFVHFAMIYNTPAAENFRRELEGPEKKTKVAYDEPWFWNVLPFEQKEKEKVIEKEKAIEHHASPQPPLPPSHHHMMNNMVPVWIMSPYGPVLQWGYPQEMPPLPQQQPQPAVRRMVPHQVAYGNRTNAYRNHPRKRLNAPRPERREATYAREYVNVSINGDSDKEDGEEEE